jgi:dienelactone hydrolase
LALVAIFLFMPVAAFAETLDARIARLEPHFTVSRPAGDGPFPVLFMLHGCGGGRPFIADIARVAVDAGAAVVNIDSYKPRRISRVAAIATVCTGMRLHGRERAGDLYAALAWARRQSWADSARFAAIGWSHGGWTIMDALALRSGADMERATGLGGLDEEPLAGLAATMLVYPYAGVGSTVGRRAWRTSPQSIAIIAEHDYIVGNTRGALERQRARGAPIDIHVFEGATHAFEDAYAEDPRVRFNQAATAREHDLLREVIASLNAQPQPAR